MKDRRHPSINSAARLVLWFVGLTLLIIVVSSVVLPFFGKVVDPEISRLAPVIVTGLFGLLAKTSNDQVPPDAPMEGTK